VAESKGNKQSHGVSTAFAVKIFKTYGSDSIKIVKENPYRLAGTK